MPEESTNTENSLTTRTRAQENQEVDASRVRHWKPGLKPNPMRGYSLSVGRRRTRAMLPGREASIVSRRLNPPAWHKPYAEALRETNPEILVKLLAATERALFERLLELAANKDASDERQDMRCAIDIMLTLKARNTQAGSEISSIEAPGIGLSRAQDRVTALGGTFEIFQKESGTTVKVVTPLR
jgi:hypothetical protein